MATYISDDAICLRVQDFSETSQIVGLFTRAHGLVPLIAKGVKRESKKGVVSGPLDLLTAGEVVFVPPKSSPAATGAELGTLAAWELLDHRTGLRTDLAALDAGMLCAEVTTLLVHPHDPHPDLFDQLEAALRLLSGHGAGQRARALVAYVKAALVAAGYGPQLDRCLRCAKPLLSDRRVRFLPTAGGIVCDDNCSPAAQGVSPRPAGPTIAAAGRIVIALSRLPTPTDLPPVTERPADVEALWSAIHLLLAQIESITDRPIRTRHLLPTIFGRPAARIETT